MEKNSIIITFDGFDNEIFFDKMLLISSVLDERDSLKFKDGVIQYKESGSNIYERYSEDFEEMITNAYKKWLISKCLKDKLK
jgi:hypothetical protein